MNINPIDDKWLDALKRYLGDGSKKGIVPFYRNPDGSIDANKTLDGVMGMYNIKPKENADVDLGRK